VLNKSLALKEAERRSRLVPEEEHRRLAGVRGQRQEAPLVDEIADVIREESYVKNPETNPTARANPRGLGDGIEEEVDARGHAVARLPRLSPIDAYYLYDPDNYYRLRP
jgi:ATP-dependent Clp protease protease subunit